MVYHESQVVGIVPSLRSSSILAGVQFRYEFVLRGTSLESRYE